MLVYLIARQDFFLKKPLIGGAVPAILILSLLLSDISCLLWRELTDFQGLIHSLEITSRVLSSLE